jgi:riboflavin synthase alpha subunit
MRRPGDKVNLETDIIAKYVEGLTERRRQDLSLEFLSEYGFVEGTDAS